MRLLVYALAGRKSLDMIRQLSKCVTLTSAHVASSVSALSSPLPPLASKPAVRSHTRTLPRIKLAQD